jgi:hypothetical protein
MSGWPDWWTIGIVVGFGVAFGLFFAAVLGARRRSVYAVAIVLAAGCAAVVGVLVWGWGEAIGGVAGGVLGAVAAEQILGGARRRGGTRGGLALIVTVVAAVVAALAIAPVVGYVEAILLPALAMRLRRRAPDRYAGLRTLARD